MPCSEGVSRRGLLGCLATLAGWSAAGGAAGGALTGCVSPPAVAAPTIVSVAAWGGLPYRGSAPPQTIRHITLHHQGETWHSGDDVAAYLRRLQQWSRDTKQWADIPYHYVVAPDGRIYAARPLAVAGDTNTEYDPAGHALVMLLGNFEAVEPTPAQLLATVDLLAAIASRHGLGADSIASHKDYSAQTLCPGRHLYRYLDSGWLRLAVAQKQKGGPQPALP